ncbi:MAG: XTP/dITP diphosphohydrolase [Glaciecola sp.]|jgi:XTP/dITP diphosphohydrolase
MNDVLVIASNNQKKIEEVKSLLSGFEIKSLKDIDCDVDIPETAETFKGNALLKAKYVYDNYQLPCFSDDSGLVVSALGGAPGIYSARYAGEDKDDDKNMDKVLSSLNGINDRSAYFITVICYYDGNEAKYFEGIIKGEITTQKTGDNGFGYDPIFLPEGSAKTFAQLTNAEKNSNSHRALAVGGFAEYIKRVV